MRRVLFDENLPRRLRRELTEFAIRTVQEEGWGSFKNGQLLRRAEGSFDVLITADRRMEFQQDLSAYDIGIVVLRRVVCASRSFAPQSSRFAQRSRR